MVDVSGMTLTQLTELSEGDDSPFAQSLRRLADASAHPDEPIAGFNSAL
jgi:FXSXX-COOH protein